MGHGAFLLALFLVSKTLKTVWQTDDPDIASKWRRRFVSSARFIDNQRNF
ncbi:hypothetical protein [Geobacillus sp. C56-T2]|nr:hypothetical protein [Geobacillus sp. C56-T2]